MSAVLHADGLTVELPGGRAAVDGVSIAVRPGEILGLVGESGSGKTTLALALLGYARPGCRIVAGSVEVAGMRLTGLGEAETRSLRGRVVSYVPQDPASALNPSLRVGDAVGDVAREHGGRAVRGGVLQALGRVHLPADAAFARRYPHELSGGQQQRVTIATALVCEPAVVVMDEPTTGLDVVTQARILEEVERLRSERGIAVVYVSHDLAVVASIADRVAVMYEGRIVEEGDATQVITRPWAAPRPSTERIAVLASARAGLRSTSRGIDAMSRRVYSCRGRVITCVASPSSTMRPSYITATRSAIDATTERSWLT